MTPIKTGPRNDNASIFNIGNMPILGTGTASGLMVSIDGEDYDYRLYSERDDDNLTLKKSEHVTTFH